MQLSDWQMVRLRNALRAYHAMESAHDGQRFTWKDVTEAIAEYTGVVVPPERLRQFVEGVRQKDGTYKHTIPKPERLEAIRNFATHADLELLTEQELEERAIEIPAAMRLLDYLDQDIDKQAGQGRIGFPDDMEGRYWSIREEAPFIRQAELRFEKEVRAGLAIVHLTERDFDEDDVPHPLEYYSAEWPTDYKSHVRYAGWAVLTPEDSIMIFLKEQRSGANRYYLTMEAEFGRDNEDRKPGFTLLHHDYPEDSISLAGAEEVDPLLLIVKENLHRYSYRGR